MNHPSQPPAAIVEPMRSYRCSVCAAEHERYTGDNPAGKCAVFEAFHAHRGALVFCVCHDCSTQIVAVWAKVRAEEIGSFKAAEAHSGDLVCTGCGDPVLEGETCHCVEDE